MTAGGGRPSSVYMRTSWAIAISAVLAIVTTSRVHADPPHRTTRLRFVAPLSAWAVYGGELRDGRGVALLGATMSYERGPLVIDGGLRMDIMGAMRTGLLLDGRVGGRIPVLGGDGGWGVDAAGLAGLRYLSYTPGGDGYPGTERVIIATASAALEVSRRVAGTRFTCRLIVTVGRTLDRNTDDGAVSGGAYGVETSVEGGLELGVAM